MKIIFLFLGMIASFSAIAASFNIGSSCDCITDNCIRANAGPPFNTSCVVPVPADSTDPDTTDHYGFQACGNASFTDMSLTNSLEVAVNISGCLNVMEGMSLNTTSFVFLAAQLYNTSFVPIAYNEDCYFQVGGGMNAIPELVGLNDTFFVGDMDLLFALGNSVANFVNEHEEEQTIAVCGTIPGCVLQNTDTGSYRTGPDFAFCLGSEALPDYWMESQGSLGHEMIATEDLPGIGADETPSDVAAVGTTQNDGELELAVALTPKDWFVRCDVGDRTLAECASLYDTYCSASGTLHSDDITCRFDCSCIRVPQNRCAYYHGFYKCH